MVEKVRAKKVSARRATQRRVPTQARSRERYERILDAAATEFAERGFEAATMEGIAALAESSIGSVYQFFPNKPALYEALVTKHLDGARAIFEVLFSEGTSHKAPSWQELIDRGVDAFAAFDRSGPVFRAIWMNLPHASKALGKAYAVNREFAARVETLLGRFAPGIARTHRGVVATMVVEMMTSALTFVARSNDERFADAMVEETKVLLKRYLAPYARVERAATSKTRKRT